MSKKLIIYLVLCILLTFLFVDVFIRIRYCSQWFLQFDSLEFNRVATPFFQLIGTALIAFTLFLNYRTFKNNKSSEYFKFFKERANNLQSDEIDNFSPLELFIPVMLTPLSGIAVK